MPIDPQIVDPTAVPGPSNDEIINLIPLSALPFLPRIQTVDALLANTSIRLPDELIHGLLHRGTKAILGASSKTGKTWLLLDLAVSVATGSPFLQWSTSPGRVLYINLEIQEAFLCQRLRGLRQHRGLTAVPNLDVLTLRGYDSDPNDLIYALEERVRNSGYSLIIIDPIYKLMAGKAENCSTGVGDLCRTIERLVVRTGAAVIYAHHFPKGNQAGKTAMDRMSGSGVFARDADTIFTMTEHAVERCFTVETTLRNMASDEPFVIELDFPVMRVRSELDAEDLQRGQRRRRRHDPDAILNLLRDRHMTTADWQALAQENGVSRATFYRVRDELAERGAVVEELNSRTWRLRDQTVPGETGETGETPGTPPPPAGESYPMEEPTRMIYVPPLDAAAPPAEPPPEATPPAPAPAPPA